MENLDTQVDQETMDPLDLQNHLNHAIPVKMVKTGNLVDLHDTDVYIYNLHA